MSNFVGLNTALTGLRAAQVGLDVAAHNVANAHTLGYTRQRVDLAARSPFASPVGPVGTGVDVQHIGRIRDAFLDARVRTAQAQWGWLDTQAQLLTRTESILGEPESGLTAELGALWDAFEELAVSPADGAARQQVVSTLGSFVARVRAIDAGWEQLRVDTAGRFERALGDVNAMLARVDEINRTLPAASLRGQAPNDLLDERDLLLDELARALGVDVETATDGRVTISLDGQPLVAAGVLREVREDGHDVTVHDPAGGSATPVTAGGEVGALREFLVTELPAQRAALDGFVATLADHLNALHADGVDASGQPAGPLLGFDGQPTAANLRVAEAVLADPARLAAGATASPQDGRNAERLAGLRRLSVDGATLDQRLSGIVVDLGARVAGARRSADAQAGLTVAAGNARASVHGVSLDEEMVSIVQFQRALEAVSRVMTAVDQALDTLINQTGVVGR